MTQNAEYAPHDWRPTRITKNGRTQHGYTCHACHKRARCPHGCAYLQWIDDEWYCPKCGDEWHDEETFGSCTGGPDWVQIDSSGTP